MTPVPDAVTAADRVARALAMMFGAIVYEIAIRPPGGIARDETSFALTRIGNENRLSGRRRGLVRSLITTSEARGHNTSSSLVAFLTGCSHVRIMHCSADVAELADAQVSEACDGDIVEVQVLSSAPGFKR
jgi:hypothetical protein